MNSREDYIGAIESALAQNSYAQQFYFPPTSEREKMNCRLAREIGYGLESWRAQGWGDLYSRIIVRNSLDSIGVAIDSANFGAHIQLGMRMAQESCP